MTQRNEDPLCRLETHQRPVVYHPEYNVSVYGIERLHPFDTFKWRRVIDFLKEEKLITNATLVEPTLPSLEELSKVHDRRYLKSIRSPFKAAKIAEVIPVALLPPCLIECKILHPLRLQAGGSVLAANLALKYGWAINVGGGFHHASHDDGAGFCFYADITMAIRDLFERKAIKNAIVVDVDAHQGNGHARDFAEDKHVFIFDVYNATVYPHDREARQFIDSALHVDKHTTNTTYISRLRKQLEKCLTERESLTPPGFDFILFNAGTDCLNGDPFGGMNLSSQCIISRDELVFEMAKARGIPICMLTSGGYQKNNAQLIAKSIENLNSKNLINLQ